MKSLRINIFVLILLFFPVFQYAQTFVISQSNKVESVSMAELRNIFLGNKLTWEGGTLIRIADYPMDDALRVKFSSEILNLAPRNVVMKWIKVSLSGKSVPPQIFRQSSELLHFIRANEGAIGYIDEKTDVPEGVKILRID